MWFLTGPKGERIYITAKKIVTFGRKKSDVILQNDESISRLHASISIEPKEIMEIGEPISSCKIKDMGSKYGTYILIRDTAVEVTGAGYNLKDQDKIRFGLQQQIFIASYIPIITVISNLNNNDKNKLSKLMDEMDGMISNEWISTCTHLTVTEAALTEKVTCALASAVPIVTLQYWEALKLAFNSGKEIPEINNFVPALNEEFVSKEKLSLCPKESRKTVFKDLIFVHFSTRHYKLFGKMIQAAGGMSILYKKKPLTTKELCSANVIVLQYPDNDASQSTQSVIPEHNSICDALQKKMRRMISDMEIPLAILHSSVDRYCNPKFKFGKYFERAPAKQTDPSDILVLDTQDVLPNVPKTVTDNPEKLNKNMKSSKSEVIIPETLDTTSLSDSMENNEFSNNIQSHVQVISENDYNVQKKSLPKMLKNYFPETENSFCNTSLNATQDNQSLEKVGCSNEKTNFIPETYDSYDENRIQASAIEVPSLQTDSNMKDIEQSNQLKQNTPTTNFVNKRIASRVERGTKLDEMKEKDTVIHKMQLLKANKNSHKTDKQKKIRIKIDLSDDDIHLPSKRPKIENESPPKILTNTVEKNNEKSSKTAKRPFDNDADGFINADIKRICTEKTSKSENSYLQNSSLFFRDNAGTKTFKKVYKKIPKRITLEEMYVWRALDLTEKDT